jgi:phosphatidylglycerophosphate synthase
VCAGLVLGYALDSADGQLARLRGGGTSFGEWLDHMVDASKISSLHLAVLICVYRFFEVTHSGLLLVPIGYSFVATVMFFGMTLTDQLRRGAGSAGKLQTQPNTWLRSVILLPTDYGLLCLTFLLLGWHSVFLSVYAVLLVCNALFLVLALGKWSHDLRSLDVIEHSNAQ